MSTQNSSAVTINLARKGDSLWAEAFRRLIRNRAAVMGMAIIFMLIVLAVGAPFIAPRSFSDQTLLDVNKVPT